MPSLKPVVVEGERLPDERSDESQISIRGSDLARNLTDATYTSSVVVDTADRRFYEPGDGGAFHGALQWRWQ